MNYHELLQELLMNINKFEEDEMTKEDLINVSYHIHADMQHLELLESEVTK